METKITIKVLNTYWLHESSGPMSMDSKIVVDYNSLSAVTTLAENFYAEGWFIHHITDTRIRMRRTDNKLHEAIYVRDQAN